MVGRIFDHYVSMRLWYQLHNVITLKIYMHSYLEEPDLSFHLFQHCVCMPTKWSNAQHLIKYEKQLPYEENKKSGNVMQQPMDSYLCGINTSSESILFRSYLFFAQ